MTHHRWIAIAVALAFTASIAAFVAIEIAVPQIDTLRERNNQLRMENVSLNRRLENVERRARMAVRESRMLREANALVRAEEQQRIAEIAELNADLELYRRLGGASGSQDPIAVQHVEWQTSTEGSGTLVMTLTQTLRYAKDTSGTLDLDISGALDGAPATIGWDAFGDGAPEPTFGFKYFQLLELPLAFPPGFEPQRLEIAGQSEDGVRFEGAYDWSDIDNP